VNHVNPKPIMLPDNEYLRIKLPNGQIKTGTAFWGAINRAPPGASLGALSYNYKPMTQQSAVS